MKREAITTIGDYTFYDGDQFKDTREIEGEQIFTLVGHYYKDGLVIRFDHDGRIEQLDTGTMSVNLQNDTYTMYVPSKFQVGITLRSKYNQSRVTVLAVAPKKDEQTHDVWYFVETYSYTGKIQYESMSETEMEEKFYIEQGMVND